MDNYISMVEKHSKAILQAFEYIWKNPETGYREWKTHAYLKKEFKKLGYALKEAGNIPGFITELDTGKEGPTIAVFAEMDALIVPEHPDADPETGAVHACGHVTQCAALLGLAAALKEEGALEGLCGKIRLVAVPAEEGIEAEFRHKLMEQGIITDISGKVEFLSRGLLDGVDMSFMIHADVDGSHAGSMNGGSNGLIAKTFWFEGVPAHAGGLPHKGINALYAATNALTSINALRETFEDKNHIRVHPIITEGGTTVNVIPDKVVLETFVRGADMNAVVDANLKINRAIASAASGIGAKAHIRDTAGSWPRWNDRIMMPVFEKAMGYVLESIDCDPNLWNAGCSDMGDMASIMPTINAYVGGASGTEHGNDYKIFDPETACVDSAKIQLLAIRLFLENNAEKAWTAINSYKPFFENKEAYFEYHKKLNREFDAVVYNDDGTITLKV